MPLKVNNYRGFSILVRRRGGTLLVAAERKLFTWSAGPAERFVRSWTGAEGKLFERAAAEAASAAVFGSCCPDRPRQRPDLIFAYLKTYLFQGINIGVGFPLKTRVRNFLIAVDASYMLFLLFFIGTVKFTFTVRAKPFNHHKVPLHSKKTTGSLLLLQIL